MKKRFKLTDEYKSFIETMRRDGVSFDKAHISRQLNKEFGTDYPVENLRRTVAKVVSDVRNPIADAAINKGICPSTIKTGWVGTESEDGDKISLQFRQQLQEAETVRNVAEETLEDIKKYAPKYKKLTRKKMTDGHLFIPNLTDIHIGKLSSIFETGDQYNVDIAIERARAGIDGLIQKSSGFNIDKIIMPLGHDALHIDGPSRATTAGTPQDTDGMRFDNFLLARDLYVELIEKLADIADVHIVYVPSNHDWTHGFFLAQLVEAWFTNHKNVTFDIDMKHRKYATYGNTLMGFSHGDGAKEKDLGMIASKEAREYWSDMKYCYWYLGHIHHTVAKEYPNFVAEYTRSISGRDGRHDRNGYVSEKAVEGFIISKQWGQVAKLTHNF